MGETGYASQLALLVEDDAAVRAVLAALLEQDGWRVEQAADGREGHALARALEPSVIVTDLRMPGMGGLEMARRLNVEDGARPPIVAVTADDSGTRREAEESGLFVTVMRKPPDPERLLGIVRRSARDPGPQEG